MLPWGVLLVSLRTETKQQVPNGQGMKKAMVAHGLAAHGLAAHGLAAHGLAAHGLVALSASGPIARSTLKTSPGTS